MVVTRREMIAAVTATASLVVLAGCTAGDDGDGGSGDGDLPQLTLGLTYVPNVQFAPFYLAEQNGYFADAGVNVTLRHHGESDQGPSGSDTLHALQALAAPQHPAEGPGGEDHQQVSAAGQEGGDEAEQHELSESVPVRIDELRDERQEEEGRLGVQRLGEHALPESATRDGSEGQVLRFAPLEEGAQAEVDEVEDTRPFDQGEHNGAGGEHGGDAEGCGEGVEHPGEGGAEGREQPLTAASGVGAGEDVKHAGAGHDRQDERGGEEDAEGGEVEHGSSWQEYTPGLPGRPMVVRFRKQCKDQ